jgi:leader peptidase (prepilin peptidase)/N-methyltransferase
MTTTFPLLSVAAGAVAGWLVSMIVKTRRLEGILTTIAAAVLMGGLAVKFKVPGPRFYVYGALVMVLIGVTLFDIRTQTIPHVVTIPGTIAGLIAGSYILPLGFKESILGLVVGGVVLLVSTIVEKIRKKEIGGGDWKYAAMIGSFNGPQRIVVALILTGVFGAIGAIALALSGNHARPHALGPWLSAGAVASILLG